MNPDPLKPAWQSQPGPAIDPGLLLAEVRRNREWLAAVVFWRDVREVGTSLVMVPVWVVMGVAMKLPWSWYLMLPSLFWIAGFLLADRRRHPQRPPDPGQPLARCVAESLSQVEHQIWLLRNVGWWYLLPLVVPMVAFFGEVNWRVGGSVWGAAAGTAAMSAVVGAVYAWVYWLNQTAVRKTLEPRRQELRTLLTGLQEPPPDIRDEPG